MNVRAMVERNIIIRYMFTKSAMSVSSLYLMALSPNFRGTTASSGSEIFFPSQGKDFIIIPERTSLSPPAVEPAYPPIIMSSIMRNFEVPGMS